MNSIVSDMTNDVLSLAWKELSKKKNQNKINKIINIITSLAIKNIQPYLYVIIAILIIMFFMNCFQFYYYLKHNKEYIDYLNISI
jgi:hypothetical protein